MYPIELVKVSKSFPAVEKGEKDLLILDQIDLAVEDGVSTAIIGKSGSGKSTLLQIAGGLDKPVSGQVFCSGTDFATLSDRDKSYQRNRHIGFIFQANLLLEDFSALENVMSPALIAGKTEKECRDRAVMLLERTGLKERMNHYPAQLSGGEKQRVAICRALMNDPDVILADEPTGALDEENASAVEDLLIELAGTEKKSLLLVTHNNDFASRCDKVYLLKNRKLTLLKDEK
ncbi:MAG: ABC transporter ATP-binding protein [Sphaerochaetaceae bacterium]|nr:ABC transporter ATP-binding protein [Sphaerochaetaceae bacterium]